MENEFWIELLARLGKNKSKKQIKSDIKNLGDIKVPLIGTLNKSKTKAQIKQDLASLNGTINLTGKVNKKGVTTSIQQATQQAQSAADKKPIQVSMNLQKDKLINDIKVFGKQNSKLFKNADMAAKYDSLLDNAKLATSNKEIANLRLQLSAMRSEIKAANLSGLTLGDTLKKAFKRTAELFASTGGIMLLTRQLRNAWTEALELDKSYTNLIKVQDELTRGDYPDYLEQCNKKAQELATTQQSLIEGVTEFSKSGYNLTESNGLSEKAAILANVGDMSASDSAKAIISGVQAYDVIDGYNDTISKAEALIDKYNEIGNTASITTAEIAEGVQAVGSVFADANTSVDEFIALLAAGNRQYQDADSLALGLRTAALRIRGCTAELEEMGEETENVYTSAAKLEEKIKGLTNIDGSGGVEILEADGETFRSIYDIFTDISKVYQQMSDTDQSALLELIAGKHRASSISATLNNMTEAQEIYQRSIESAGSAQEEYDKYLESSEASLNRFKASMTETYQSIINGETVTGLLNCGNATLQFVNSLGLVESTLRGLVAIGIVKSITTLSTAFKASAIQASNFGTALNTVKNMSTMARGTTEYTNALKMLKTTSAGLSDVQLKQVLASKALSNQDRIAILRTTGLTKAQAQAKLTQMELTQSTNAQTAANASATASTFSLTAAVKGFGLSLKAAFLSNPIGISIMAISTAIGVVTSAISKHNQAVEEARQKAKDSSSQADILSGEISDLTNKYLTLSQAIKTDESAKEDLMTTQTELLKKLGLEGQSLDELIEKYGSLSEAIRQTSIESLKNAQIDLIAGVDAAKEELLEIGKDGFWGNNNIISASGDEVIRAFKALEKAGVVDSSSYGTGGGALVLIGDDTTTEGILENYQRLEEALLALRNSNEFTAEELSDNSLYQAIYDRYSEMRDEVEAYNSSIESLNENLAQQTMLMALQGNEIPKTEETFETFKQELIDTAVASKQFIGTEEEIENAINSYLSTVPEFEGFYSIPLENELEKVNEDFAKTPSTISSTIDQLNTQLKPAFDALKEAYLDIFTTDDDGKEVFTLENIDLSMLDEIKSAIDDLNGNEDLGIYIDYSSFDNLANVLTDTKSTAEDVHNAINAFAGEIIQSLNPSLGETTEETYQLTQAMLKSLGVINSEEVMASTLGYSLEELAELRKAAASAGFDLENATDREIRMFIWEQTEAGNCSEALYLLQLKKVLLNQTAINTTGDIEYILGLAQSAGVASNALSKLADAKAMLESATAKGDTRGIYEAKKYARELQGEIRNDIVSFEIPEIKFEPPSNSNSNSKSSGSSSEKDTTETFDWIEQAIENIEKEIQSLDETVNSAYSTFSQKNKALADEIGKVNDEINLQQKAYDEYMRKAESVGLSDQYKSLVQSGDINIEDIKDEKLQKQIDEYQKWYDKAQEANEAIKDLKTDMKDLYVSAYELQTENLKDRLDSDSITEKEYLEGLKQAYESFYADIEDFAQQYHEAVLEYLGEEKDYLNDVASAAAAIIDREIDAIQDDADAQEDSIQKQIDLLEAKKKPLQDELDALEDKAKHEELIYNLQKAQADLAKAETQRTKLLYTKDKGMIYTADEIEIRNAQKDVDDAKLEIEKQNIQDQIDLIDDEISKYNNLIDQINKAADDQIDALEKIKNKWQEAIDIQEYAKNVSLFTNEFGTDAINKLLTGNDDDLLAQWKDNYVNTLAAIDMESQGYIGDMAQQMASLYDIDLSSLQAQFGNVKDSVGEVTDALGDTVNALAGGSKTTYINGNEGTSIISKGQPANSSSDTGDSLQSAIQSETETAMDAFDQHTDKLTNEVIPAIQAATEEMNAFNEAADKDIEKTITITYSVSGSPSFGGTANAEGTAHVEGTAKVSGDWGVQQGGKSLVGETGREIWVHSGSGRFETVGDNGAEFINMQRGDIILNHTQTEKLLKDGKISSRGRALANGTVVEPDGTIHTRRGDLIPLDSPAFQNLDFKELNLDPEQFQIYKKIGEISKLLDLGVMKVQGINQMMSDMVSKTVNNNVVTNNNNNPKLIVNGGINLTCPGVTSQEVLKNAKTLLENEFSGLALKAYQQSKITR